MEPHVATVLPAEAFAPLLTESLNGFAVFDASGRYAFVSASLCDLLSLPKDALLGCATARESAAGSVMRDASREALAAACFRAALPFDGCPLMRRAYAAAGSPRSW